VGVRGQGASEGGCWACRRALTSQRLTTAYLSTHCHSHIHTTPREPHLPPQIVYGTRPHQRLPEVSNAPHCKILTLDRLRALGYKHPKPHHPPKVCACGVAVLPLANHAGEAHCVAQHIQWPALRQHAAAAAAA
jgi:hypothetical protein